VNAEWQAIMIPTNCRSEGAPLAAVRLTSRASGRIAADIRQFGRAAPMHGYARRNSVEGLARDTDCRAAGQIGGIGPAPVHGCPPSLTEQRLTGCHLPPLRWLVSRVPGRPGGRRGCNVQARAGHGLEVMRGSTASVRDGDDQLAPHVPLAAERERRGQLLERQDVGDGDTQLTGVGHPT